MTYVFDEATIMSDILDSVPSATYYWADARWIKEGESLSLTDREDDEEGPWTVDIETLKRGLGIAIRIVQNEYQLKALVDMETDKWEEVDWDIDTVDILTQCGLFGELVYA